MQKHIIICITTLNGCVVHEQYIINIELFLSLSKRGLFQYSYSSLHKKPNSSVLGGAIHDITEGTILGATIDRQ